MSKSAWTEKDQIENFLKERRLMRSLEKSYKADRLRYSNPMIQPEPEGSTQGYPLVSVEVLRLDISAGNPVKEILFKLNLPNHRSILTDSKMEVKELALHNTIYAPEDVKVPLILGRPFLSTAHPKIDVLKRKITLRVGDEKIIFKSMKLASSLIKKVYMLSLRERMDLDLEVRLMRKTLVLNRSLDPLYGDYVELNDLNVPLELRRDQVDDLMPIIEEVVETMEGYRDQDMGDIILREPLCKVSCVEARRFDG
ncbi:hypothetical protein Tco_0713932 [Tanacetum coccineum]